MHAVRDENLHEGVPLALVVWVSRARVGGDDAYRPAVRVER